MLAGIDPYPVVGPGLQFDWPWELRYPGPAFVAILPAVWLPEWLASVLFVSGSTFLLAYGMTRDSWHRIPALFSGPFILAAGAAQWSPLFTATWFIPQLSVIFAIKPTVGLAAFLFSPTSTHRRYAAIGGAVLLLLSMLLFPSWPESWYENVTSTSDYSSPLLQTGGFLIALVLLRWRRREAWIVFLMAVIPQAHSIYDVLILLVLVPATYREAVFLAAAANLGFILMIIPENDGQPYRDLLGTFRVLTCYLPSVLLILRRPNEPGLADKPVLNPVPAGTRA